MKNKTSLLFLATASRKEEIKGREENWKRRKTLFTYDLILLYIENPEVSIKKEKLRK